MLCGNEWGLSGRCHGSIMDALRQRMVSESTSCLRYHGSIMDALWQTVWVDVIMFRSWMLCGNERGLSGRHHSSIMDAVGMTDAESAETSKSRGSG